LATAAATSHGLRAAQLDALGLTLFSGAGWLHFACVGGTLGLADCLRADWRSRRFGRFVISAGVSGRLFSSSFLSRRFLSGRLFSSSFLSRRFLSGRLFSSSFLGGSVVGGSLLDGSLCDDLFCRSLFFWSFGLCRLVSHL
jgi:hypothetical protein